LDKHEGNSVHIISPQSLDQLYSITAGIGGGGGEKKKKEKINISSAQKV